MRYLTAVLVLVGLLGCVTHAHAVTYAAGPPISLAVKASTFRVTPGQSVHLYITYADKDYVTTGNNTTTFDDPVTVTWQCTGGSLSKFSAGDIQPLDLLWVSPPTPGYYTVILSATDSGQYANDAVVRRVVEFNVQQAGATTVPSARVGANPQTIQLDRNPTSLITAQVLGQDIAGKEVSFYTTRGVLSAAKATTDANGVASVRLTATAQDIGAITVVAAYGNTSSTTHVEVVAHTPAPAPPAQIPGPPPPPNYQPAFLISVDPPSVPADGQSMANVSLRLTDMRGLGIRRQDVNFTISYGRIEPRALTDNNGYARVRVFAPNQPGQAMIYARAGALQSYTTVTFMPVQTLAQGSPRLFLTITPTNVAADGASKAVIEVLALDSDGHALANTTVDFSSTLGTMLTPRMNTNRDGRAGSYLVAPVTPGLATVTARLGDITAASQLAFLGVSANGPTLDVRTWNGQSTVFAADNWLYRIVKVENGQQGALTNTLLVLDANGKIAKQIDPGKSVQLLRDQNGVAHGYAVEERDTVRIEVLRADGSSLRSLTMPLPIGSRLADLRYADPAGQVVVMTANPDGTRPQLVYFSPDGNKIFTLKDGLEALPVAALGSDGYLALTFAGGTVRLYNPSGDIMTEPRRPDNLPVTRLAIGPGGEWVAIASRLAGQTETPPHLSVFSRQGSLLVSKDLDVLQLAPAGKSGILIATAESTRYLSLATRDIVWTLPGAFERFLESDGTGIIAGQRDPKTQDLLSRVLVIRLSDGKILGSQLFDDFHEVRGIIPPATDGKVGVLTANFALHFPLPADK
ncbi:MAG TPA: invasin domain 3-containing protein [Armatimonadota bacterium]|jgi:hypothetical protein